MEINQKLGPGYSAYIRDLPTIPVERQPAIKPLQCDKSNKFRIEMARRKREEELLKAKNRQHKIVLVCCLVIGTCLVLTFAIRNFETIRELLSLFEFDVSALETENIFSRIWEFVSHIF